MTAPARYSIESDSLVTVVAPISGTIADQTITPGESVNEAGVALMTIMNGNGVWATAKVYKKDLSRISEEQRVWVHVAGLDGTLNATISYIGAAVQGETRVLLNSLVLLARRLRICLT